MNKANLKSYAPQARKDFIAAVTARANQLGLSFKAGSLEVAPAQTQGDVTVIAGQAWPSKASGQRDKLIERIRKDGFEHTMEAVAYTWFNRFAALRYMELHDYLGHGHRALSSTAGGLPDILTHATDLSNDLPGLNAARVTELKLAGNRDGELYRMLLVAQCNALSRAMPFLFERIDDDSELLLPDNLLRSDSVIANLVEAIPEEDWVEVEIIGWLYQFYISEKKDQVIGQVVKSEDIPAATQLFTPNWIVQYLVQNSVGRLWLMANPQSTLAKEWPYYITPAEQTPEVQAQLDALIQTRVREDGDTLNPESITVLDPACGSGHILVVAYDVLKAIYLERGYQPRAIPRLILEKNLFGLDIDDRAAQMAGFALLMKARADDRRLFTATDDAGNLQPPKLNVLSLQESKGLSVDELATHLAPFKVQRATITALVETFEHAKTFGSLIQITYSLNTHLTLLPEILTLVKVEGDMYASAAAADLLPLVQQAQLLAMQFDAVVANPPYMGSKYHIPTVKSYLKAQYPGFEKDLFAAFTARNSYFGKPSAEIAVMSSNVWMFLSSYEEMREWLIDKKSLNTLVQLSNSGFDGATVFICAFTFTNQKISDCLGSFIRLTDFSRSVDQGPKTLEAIHNKECGWFYKAKSDDFRKIPGGLIGYWLSEKSLNCFLLSKLGQHFDPQVGLQTSNTDRFIRLWPEISYKNFCTDSQSNDAATATGIKWFPLDKGGEFRRWYGNNTHAVNWLDNGAEIKRYVADKYPYLNGNVDYVIKDRGYFFRPGVTWGKIGSGTFSVRATYGGSIFSDAGMKVPTSSTAETEKISGFLNSTVSLHFLKCLSPTLNFEKGSIASLPFKDLDSLGVRSLVEISKKDWDEFEGSYDFTQPHLLTTNSLGSLSMSWALWRDESAKRISKAKQLEEENNRIYIDAYGLQDELTAEVPESQITLARADREKDCQRLISFAIGCMMGRYSLDEPGLIYAHAGNFGFEPGRYTTFPADADGIVPITDELWFAEDAPSRIREFLRAVWGPDTLEENMAWLAESLGTKASETPDETIRRYIADKFFKDHLQTYKKRPIYWLFSSGKQGAFQALVYLHRYTEGTLARLRAEYVVPLTGKIQSRIEMLQKDAAAASSTAVRNKLAKEVEKLKKKHSELLAYDEQLRHYADMRITLDLDDGVKVNYGKFGDLLADVKAVTGGASDD
jgi:type II restriction/modification system DNA methylase subunit YeeA